MKSETDEKNQTDYFRESSVSKYDGKLWNLGLIIDFLSIIPIVLAFAHKINEVDGAILWGVMMVVGVIVSLSDVDTRIY